MIIAINDVLIQGRPQRDVIGMIKAASVAPIRFVIQALPGQAPAGSEATYEQPAVQQQQNSLRAVQIAKGPDGYGMNLTRVANVPVLKNVDQGGPAAVAGARTGDLIRQVNGSNTAGLAHKDVVQLIKGTAAGAPLVLTLETPVPGQNLEARLSAESARADTVQDQMRRNTGAHVHSEMTQRASMSIMEARARAEQAVAGKRIQERKLELARQHEAALQLKYDQLQSLNDKIEEVEQEVDDLSKQIIFKREAARKVATLKEIAGMDEIILMIETQAVDELDEQQGNLPELLETDTDMERAGKEVSIKKFEMEVAVTQRQLALSKLKELELMENTSASKRTAEQKKRAQDVAANEDEVARDAARLAERKSRVDLLLKGEKEKRDAAKQAALQKAEDHRIATQKAIDERKQKAGELQARFQAEDEAKSLTEQGRRERIAAEKKFAAEEEKRVTERKRVQEERARAAREAEENALLDNPQAAFGGTRCSLEVVPLSRSCPHAPTPRGRHADAGRAPALKLG